MARKLQELSIAPAILSWARKSIDKTVEEAAKRLGVDESLVRRWESGEKRPTLRQVQELAGFYKRSLAVFFLPAPPNEPPPPTDFRTLPADTTKSFSEKTILAFRRARRLQGLARELGEMTPEIRREVRLPRTATGASVPDLAARVRKALGIALSDQAGWPDERAALGAWRQAIEAQGVLVFEAGFPIEEGRAFSLYDDLAPAIVLNSKDARAGRIFSLFHEFAHLMLGEGGICDCSDEGKAVERFCNAFAAELLVPRQAFLDDVGRLNRGSGRWSDDELLPLARRYHVSREMILRRLVDFRRATMDYYLSRKRQWAEELRQPRRGGRAVPARRCLRQTGVPLTSLVLESARNERITYRDVSDFLSIGLKHLPQVELLVREGSARYG